MKLFNDYIGKYFLEEEFKDIFENDYQFKEDNLSIIEKIKNLFSHIKIKKFSNNVGLKIEVYYFYDNKFLVISDIKIL